MDGSSLHALACELLGDDPYPSPQPRPSLAQAARVCPRGQIMAARATGPDGDCDIDIAVVKLDDGRVFALPDHCPHAGVPLSQGFFDEDQQRLVCPRHGWEFDVHSGECIGRRDVVLAIEPVSV